MGAVLVTGMSGTGKSTALAELARRGHDTLDTDDPGWIEVAADGEPRWRLDRVRAQLAAPRGAALFVAGCVVNQGELYPLFDAVVLLSAPVDVLLARVADRDNPFGSTAADRARIAADARQVEPLLRAGATHELVATAPVATVVAALERLVSRPRTTG